MTVTDNVDYKKLNNTNIASDNNNAGTVNNTETAPAPDNDKNTAENSSPNTNASESGDKSTVNETGPNMTNTVKPQNGNISDDDLIKTLEPGVKYIQLGAFNMMVNASVILNKAKSAGYDAKVFKDTDGYYKVMVIPEKGNEKETLNKMKNSFNKDAYIKSLKAGK